MQQFGQLAKTHTYKNKKKGEEQQMNINDMRGYPRHYCLFIL